jgi:succinate dehydrogenase flavin-adding protein (antitoxin of CptAB toxin-antitoxin module)
MKTKKVCEKMSKSELNKWSKLLNIPENNICNFLRNTSDLRSIKDDDIVEVALLFRLGVKRSTVQQILVKIHDYVQNFGGDMKLWITWLGKLGKEHIGLWIVKIIKQIFSVHKDWVNKLPVSEAHYKVLVDGKKREISSEFSLNSVENDLLNRSLQTKLCSCIDYIKKMDGVQGVVETKTKKKGNPYAICYASVVKRRKFGFKNISAKKCSSKKY